MLCAASWTNRTAVARLIHWYGAQKRRGWTCRSTERERKGFRARIEELDLEQSIGDRLWLADQLVHPLVGNRADTLVVDISSVSGTRRLSIDQHAKPHRGPWC